VLAGEVLVPVGFAFANDLNIATVELDDVGVMSGALRLSLALGVVDGELSAGDETFAISGTFLVSCCARDFENPSGTGGTSGFAGCGYDDELASEFCQPFRALREP
jgi:hypothetical protein